MIKALLTILAGVALIALMYLVIAGRNNPAVWRDRGKSIVRQQSSNPSDSDDPSNQLNAGVAAQKPSLANVNPSGIANYGARVYYFPLTRAKFGNALADFLLTETNLEVTAMAVDIVRMYGDSQARDVESNQRDWGGVAGYFVTFREKKSE